MSAAARVKATKLWFETIVIGKKLCPFAPPLLEKKLDNTLSNDVSTITDKKFPKLRIHASNSLTHTSLIDEITNEAQLLVNGDTTNIIMDSTTYDIDSTNCVKITESDQNEDIEYHQNHEKPETTLVVLHPSLCQSFRDFIQISWELQSQAIVQSGFVNDLQINLYLSKLHK